MSLSEIATDAEDEEGLGEEEAQRERIVRLLEALKQGYNQSKKADSKEERDRCRAEMRQIAGDIRFSETGGADKGQDSDLGRKNRKG